MIRRGRADRIVRGLAGVLAILTVAIWGAVAGAQEFSGLARLDPAQTRMDGMRDGFSMDLTLSQPVPWRVFTLDDPARMVLDFAELDFAGVDAEALIAGQGAVADLRFGALRPGWSRMVIDLNGSFGVAQAGMIVDPDTGAARITLRARKIPPQDFAARSGAPMASEWGALAASDTTAQPQAEPGGDDVLVVAIDPGHGGIDPGAVRAGVRESDVMLALGLELADLIGRQPGMRAVLTRDSDHFVPLAQRMTLARGAGADVFLSLHADALDLAQVAGASFYVLTEDAADGAVQRMAERHERGDLLAGLDLTGQDDRTARILMELARQETGPASLRLQSSLIASFGQTGARLTARPARQGELAVLMSTDFPSVLIETGFLSNDADRAALQSSAGRAPIVAAIARAVAQWAEEEAAIAKLRHR